MHLLLKSLVNVGGIWPGLEAKDRRIADMWTFPDEFLTLIYPVVNHAVLALLVFEEAVDPIHDCNIQIEE